MNFEVAHSAKRISHVSRKVHNYSNTYWFIFLAHIRKYFGSNASIRVSFSFNWHLPKSPSPIYLDMFLYNFFVLPHSTLKINWRVTMKGSFLKAKSWSGCILAHHFLKVMLKSVVFLLLDFQNRARTYNFAKLIRVFTQLEIVKVRIQHCMYSCIRIHNSHFATATK